MRQYILFDWKQLGLTIRSLTRDNKDKFVKKLIEKGKLHVWDIGAQMSAIMGYSLIILSNFGADWLKSWGIQLFDGFFDHLRNKWSSSSYTTATPLMEKMVVPLPSRVGSSLAQFQRLNHHVAINCTIVYTYFTTCLKPASPLSVSVRSSLSWEQLHPN